MSAKFESRVGRATVGNTGRTPASAVSSKTSFTCCGWGVYRVYNSFSGQGKGKYKVSFQTFQCSGKGVYGVLQNFSCSGKGIYRAANDALARWELYKGVDGQPDFDAAPWETFTSTPHETAALAADHIYHIVLRLRNKYGVLEQTLDEWIVEIDAGGNLVAPRPSAPEDIAIVPAANGAVRITASYNFRDDGDDAATQWLIYMTSNGDDPDPAVDTPTVVTMQKKEFVEFLDETLYPTYTDDYADDPFAGGSPRMTSFDYDNGGEVTWRVADANKCIALENIVYPAADAQAVAYYNDYNDVADIEIKAKLYIHAGVGTRKSGIALRINPSAKTFYTGWISYTEKLAIARSDGYNDLTVIAEGDQLASGIWYCLKFKAEGTTFKLKYWLVSGSEPTTGGPDNDGYQLKVTDSNYDTGKIGFYGEGCNIYNPKLYDFESVKDGLTAKVIVRTRRVDAGPVNIDSTNTDIVSTTSDTDGPSAVTEFGIFFDDDYKQYPYDGGGGMG